MKRALLVLLVALAALNAQTKEKTAVSSVLPDGYRFQPEDQLAIRVLDLEEIGDRTLRVDSHGNIHVPLLGIVPVKGMTVDELEEDLARRLKVYMKEPSVTVNVTEFKTQSVSVLGEVAQPGIRQIRPGKTLFDVISECGGVKSDAGTIILITRSKKRGVPPLPNAKDDPTGDYWIASVNMNSLINSQDPRDNILLMADDVISVPHGESIYVLGDVQKAGKIELGQSGKLSALQAISLSGGLQKTASRSHARILRLKPGSQERAELPLNLANIYAGKQPDVSLQPEDILMVPNSEGRVITTKVLEGLFGAGLSGVVLMGTR